MQVRCYCVQNVIYGFGRRACKIVIFEKKSSLAALTTINKIASKGQEFRGDCHKAPTTSCYESYVRGGPTDLWAQTWSAAEINDPLFGYKVLKKTTSRDDSVVAF
jgi:hypothetical protein